MADTTVVVDSVGLSERIGVPLSPESATLALTHRSFAYEHGGISSNERLEFLGDSVLGIVVTDTIFRTHPDAPEGQLARMRAGVVNARSLADVARTIGLGEFILLGRGEQSSGGAEKPSILADTVEAIIGAIYLEHGLAVASEFIHRFFDPLIHLAAQLGAGLDWKSSLQELTAERGLGVPRYTVEQTGPAHDRRFSAVVEVAGRHYEPGAGRSKKEAQHIAAANAWNAISAGDTSPTDGGGSGSDGVAGGDGVTRDDGVTGSDGVTGDNGEHPTQEWATRAAGTS